MDLHGGDFPACQHAGREAVQQQPHIGHIVHMAAHVDVRGAHRMPLHQFLRQQVVPEPGGGLRDALPLHKGKSSGKPDWAKGMSRPFSPSTAHWVRPSASS